MLTCGDLVAFFCMAVTRLRKVGRAADGDKFGKGPGKSEGCDRPVTPYPVLH